MKEENITQLWKHFQNGLSYQQALGLTRQIPLNVDFVEGKQWGNPAEYQKHLPRPVVNLTKMIVRNKKASIVGSKVRLAYSAPDDADRSEKMTEFNTYMSREMELEERLNRFVGDAVIKGSGFMHYYWDTEAQGALGEYIGGVRAEIIDPLNIFFANPQEQNEQKQKWILIASRIDVRAAKAMADKSLPKEVLDEIVPDGNETSMYNEEHEQNESKLCTVLTRYFRKDGEVYFERATKSVMLHKPIALTPDFPELKADESDDEDAAESSLPDKAGKTPYRATLYPIVAYAYETRERSIYGISEVEGIIPNQRAINFNIAMQLLNVQNMAWGKYIAKKGALNGQQITNAPGQHIIDHSPGTSFGIQKMQEQPLSQAPLQLVDSLTDMTRAVTGSTEVMTGEQTSANQSGVAIAQLQAQALRPIAELKDRFWRACERCGKVMEQFYKLFYENKAFNRNVDGQQVAETFSGEEYQDVDFAITVEAGAGTQFSEALTISLLDGLLQGQQIDFATYVELFPESAMPFKATLKKTIQAREASENAQLKAIVEQQAQQLEQAAQYIKGTQATMQQATSVIQQFDGVKQQLDMLKVEGAAKILTQNKALEALSAKNQEVTQDAQALAQMAAGQGNKTA